MGHCAPAVMQTVLDITHAEQEWLVKLMAGMPGGIGNTGFECGAITSPLVILGLRSRPDGDARWAAADFRSRPCLLPAFS